LKHAELTARYLDLGGSSKRHHHHDHSIGNETTLDKPVKEIVQMEEILWELVEEVGGRLRREELFARCLTVKIRYANFQTLTRSRTLPPDLFRQRNFEIVSDLLRQNVSPVEQCGFSA
jgi:DNA polymerase-4